MLFGAREQGCVGNLMITHYTNFNAQLLQEAKTDKLVDPTQLRPHETYSKPTPTLIHELFFIQG